MNTSTNCVLFLSIFLTAFPFDSVNSFPFVFNRNSTVTTQTTTVMQSMLSLSSSTTENPPTNVSTLVMKPDVNHALTIDHQNSVINVGQSLSMGITNAIVRPLTFFNNLIGSAAGSLPGLFAANGAALGTAIATPIQMATLATNAAISGITGTIVSIPISLASGGVAQLVGLVGTGRQILAASTSMEVSEPSSTSTTYGQLFLQPLAILTGANSILAGVSLNVLSQSVKSLGLGIEQFGVSLTNTGKNAKYLGSVLIGWANGRPLYAPVVNDTETNMVEVDLSDFIGPMEIVADIDANKIFNVHAIMEDGQHEESLATMMTEDDAKEFLISTETIPNATTMVTIDNEGVNQSSNNTIADQ